MKTVLISLMIMICLLSSCTHKTPSFESVSENENRETMANSPDTSEDTSDQNSTLTTGTIRDIHIWSNGVLFCEDGLRYYDFNNKTTHTLIPEATQFASIDSFMCFYHKNGISQYRSDETHPKITADVNYSLKAYFNGKAIFHHTQKNTILIWDENQMSHKILTALTAHNKMVFSRFETDGTYLYVRQNDYDNNTHHLIILSIETDEIIRTVDADLFCNYKGNLYTVAKQQLSLNETVLISALPEGNNAELFITDFSIFYWCEQTLYQYNLNGELIKTYSRTSCINTESHSLICKQNKNGNSIILRITPNSVSEFPVTIPFITLEQNDSYFVIPSKFEFQIISFENGNVLSYQYK